MAKSRETFRKKITTPELIEQIDPENKRLMNMFLRNFATKRSPLSTKNYKSDLEIFFVWCVLNLENKKFSKIRKIEFAEFFDFALTELKWSPNRYLRMHSCLSSFSDWIENYLDDEEGYEDFRNLVKKIEKPVKDTVRKKTVLEKEDINKLFEYFEQNNMTQDACLLALLISSGSRAREIGRFKISIIDENNTAFDDLFLETTEEIQVKGRGVNGKQLIRYIRKDTFLPYYKKWLEERNNRLVVSKKEHDYIFINRNGDPGNDSLFRKWVGKWSEVIDKPIYLHSFRHYYTTELLRIGLEQELVQNIIGWESTDMVRIYDDSTAKSRYWKGLEKLKNVVNESA